MSAATLLALMLSCASQVQPKDDAEAELRKAWLKVCTQHAMDYRICPTGKPKEEFKFIATPIFRHAQPARGAGDIGGVWLWVQADGRPGVVGTVFAFNAGEGYRWVAHEFHSLADEPLTAVWREREQWVPARAGLDWKPIPNAPAPADSPEQRLRQIRSLSERFKAHSIDFRGGRWELRLIPKPVYRYELKKPDAVLDGALLAICQGTDPEIFLAIEARKAGDGYRWHYACAAFSDYELRAQLDDTEVWAPPKGTPNSRREPHWWYGFIERTRLPEENSQAEE